MLFSVPYSSQVLIILTKKSATKKTVKNLSLRRLEFMPRNRSRIPSQDRPSQAIQPEFLSELLAGSPEIEEIGIHPPPPPAPTGDIYYIKRQNGERKIVFIFVQMTVLKFR
jgi:hypothetical protein